MRKTQFWSWTFVRRYFEALIGHPPILNQPSHPHFSLNYLAAVSNSTNAVGSQYQITNVSESNSSHVFGLNTMCLQLSVAGCRISVCIDCAFVCSAEQELIQASGKASFDNNWPQLTPLIVTSLLPDAMQCNFSLYTVHTGKLRQQYKKSNNYQRMERSCPQIFCVYSLVAKNCLYQSVSTSISAPLQLFCG